MVRIETDSMTPEQFIYWLQGMLETKDTNKLTEKQVQQIRDHLGIVFTKRTPDITVTTPQKINVPYKPTDGMTFIC